MITAIGMVDDVPVMVLAIVVAVGVMMFAARPIGEFVDRHPTIKMLALAFLILIGVVLVAEGLRLARAEGLHLLRDGVFARSGGAQPATAQEDAPCGFGRTPGRRCAAGGTVEPARLTRRARSLGTRYDVKGPRRAALQTQQAAQ